MGNPEIISRDIVTLKEYGNYIGSSMNEQMERVAELERRVAELESVILKVKNIDWKTVKYKVDETF